MITLASVDAFDAGLVLGASGPLLEFNRAGILSPSDVHVALRLARLGDSAEDAVCLGAAFAARAPRLGHVCVDLATIRQTASSDVDTPADLTALPWPDPATWVARLAESALVGDDRPLHLADTTLYLDRLWQDQRQVARDLAARASAPIDIARAPLATALARLFQQSDDDPDLQRLAAAAALVRRVSVVAGGPGTGKTRTVARVLALLDELAQADALRPPRIALAAPTGKAAARLEEAVRRRCGRHAGGGRRPSASARAAGEHHPPAAGLQPREPQPVPPQPRQPAPLRRGRGRRDLHGLALSHGPPGRGGAARSPPHPRG